jgi:oligopeptide/dipeptide ABC transporter ATP-binding protein
MNALPPQPVLSIENLDVSYFVYGRPPVEAIVNLSLTIAPSEIVGLVGEIGCGKTTLARSIMQLVRAPGRIARGRIAFEGRDLVGLDPAVLRTMRSRDLAMIVPNPRGELNPMKTIGEQVADVIRLQLGRGRLEARELALETIAAVKIPDPKRRYNAYPHELSGGMAQRVVIAMAIACSPRLIISDDATSGLDVTVQAQILDLLTKLIGQKQAAMLYITRDMGVAANFCDRIAIMYRGAIVEIAQRSSFFGNPLHPYSNMLLASFAHRADLRRQWTRQESGRSTEVSGCVYETRCVRARERCRVSAPTLGDRGSGHMVACYFPVDRNAR